MRAASEFPDLGLEEVYAEIKEREAIIIRCKETPDGLNSITTTQYLTEVEELHRLMIALQNRRIQALRDKTGLAILACKALLIEAGWNVDLAQRRAINGANW